MSALEELKKQDPEITSMMLIAKKPSKRYPSNSVVLYRKVDGTYVSWIENKDGERFWGHYITGHEEALKDWEGRD